MASRQRSMYCFLSPVPSTATTGTTSHNEDRSSISFEDNESGLEDDLVAMSESAADHHGAHSRSPHSKKPCVVKKHRVSEFNTA